MSWVWEPRETLWQIAEVVEISIADGLHVLQKPDLRCNVQKIWLVLLILLSWHQQCKKLLVCTYNILAWREENARTEVPWGAIHEGQNNFTFWNHIFIHAVDNLDRCDCDCELDCFSSTKTELIGSLEKEQNTAERLLKSWFDWAGLQLLLNCMEGIQISCVFWKLIVTTYWKITAFCVRPVIATLSTPGKVIGFHSPWPEPTSLWPCPADHKVGPLLQKRKKKLTGVLNVGGVEILVTPAFVGRDHLQYSVAV